MKFTVNGIRCEIPVDAEAIVANPTATKANARRMNAIYRFNFIVGMPERNMRIPKNDVLPDPKTPFGQRVQNRLRDKRVVWLTTVAADGTPQPNPVCFLWQEPDRVLVYSHADSHKLTHVWQHPRVSLNFDGDGEGGDIVVLVGDAQIAADEPPAPENPAYLRKYADAAELINGNVAAGNEPSIALWISITKVRGS